MYGQPTFGGGVPHYGPAPTMPGPPKQRHPLRLVVLALIALAVVALGALVVTGLVSSPTVQYQNDDFTVPPPDTSTPHRSPVRRPSRRPRTSCSGNPFYDQTAPIPVRCSSQPINVDDGLRRAARRSLQWSDGVPGARLATAGDARPGSRSYVLPSPSTAPRSPRSAARATSTPSTAVPTSRSTSATSWPTTSQTVVSAGQVGRRRRDGPRVRPRAAGADRHPDLLSLPLGQLSDDKRTELLYSRRSETQADCFSGMFVRAVSRSLRGPAVRRRGDHRDLSTRSATHADPGTRRSRAATGWPGEPGLLGQPPA